MGKTVAERIKALKKSVADEQSIVAEGPWIVERPGAIVSGRLLGLVVQNCVRPYYQVLLDSATSCRVRDGMRWNKGRTRPARSGEVANFVEQAHHLAIRDEVLEGFSGGVHFQIWMGYAQSQMRDGTFPFSLQIYVKKLEVLETPS
jgi:hypothetical protein